MIAFKGFSKDLKSVHGNGKSEDCCFVPGETKTAQRSKTQREGYHCTENVFGCLRWHPLGGSSRIWMVEASGDIDEGQDCQISCTQITLIKELTILEIRCPCLWPPLRDIRSGQIPLLFYMAHLTDPELAEYLKKELKPNIMMSAESILRWLQEEV